MGNYKTGKLGHYQFAVIVDTHRPKASVGFEKQAVISSRRNGSDTAGHDFFGPISADTWAVTQLTQIIVTHHP